VVTSLVGFASTPVAIPAPESVVTSLATFAGSRPHRPGGRNPTPAALRQLPAVFRHTPVSAAIRRSDHPRRPSATTAASSPRRLQCRQQLRERITVEHRRHSYPRPGFQHHLEPLLAYPRRPRWHDLYESCSALPRLTPPPSPELPPPVPQRRFPHALVACKLRCRQSTLTPPPDSLSPDRSRLSSHAADEYRLLPALSETVSAERIRPKRI
jgi:hypothetical protein